MNILVTIIVSLVSLVGGAWGIYNFVPINVIESLSITGNKELGSTITTIQGTDRLTDSRTVINDNFSNLNAGKIENSTSTLESLTSAANLATIGTISTGVWNGTVITGTYGGTGSSTLSSNQVMLGDTTTGLKTVVGWGTSGQLLTSGGNSNPPTWSSASFDTTIDYELTGLWNYHASTTFWDGIDLNATSTPICLSGDCIKFAGAGGASSTILRRDENNNAKWELPDWVFITSSTTDVALDVASTTWSGTYNNLKILVDFRGASTADSLIVRLNGDSANNYGYYLSSTWGGVTSVSDTNSIPISNTATTSAAYFVFEINNQSAFRKMLTFRGAQQATGAQAPADITGSAVWNNTSASITSFELVPGAGTLNSGMTTTVFGR